MLDTDIDSNLSSDPVVTVRIRPLALGDAAELLEIRLRNRAYLEPWEPQRNERFYTPAGQRAAVEAGVAARDAGRAYPFVVEHEGRIVGGVNLNEVVRGVFQNAYLGYWIDGARGGRGFATAAVRQAVAFAFGEAGLHRVQAAVMPRNAGSIRVLEKAGFREEGLALRYLQIAGVWEDHLLFAVTND
ncbi:MAG: GNAT family N-acetyltransferase [Gaiellaceae bacterium]